MSQALLLVAGGYCIGDALKAADLLQHRGTQGWTVHLLVGTYARPAWDFLMKSTTIPIASIEVAAEARYDPPCDYDDMIAFWQRFVQGQQTRHWHDLTWPCEEMDRTVIGGTMDGYDRVEWLRWEALHPPYRCPQLMLRNTVSPERVPILPDGPWIGVQVNTKTGDLKRIPAIWEADYPGPVVAFGTDATYMRADWTPVVGQSLTVVAHCLRQCRVFVGVCSAITRLAAMLGVPTIMCHYGQGTMPNDGVAECGGMDVYLPTWMELEMLLALHRSADGQAYAAG